MFLSRSFVFLRYDVDYFRNGPPNPNDYFANPDAAGKVVQLLGAMGVKYFLVTFGETYEDYLVIGEAIEKAGLQFFTDERWPYENACNNDRGHFDSANYIRDRVQPVLIRLKNKFPSTFVGFHFKDEPGLAHFDNLGDLKDCLDRQPEFQGMKVFLNLSPIHASHAALSGLVNFTEKSDMVERLLDSRRPSDFGVDCSTNAIVDPIAAHEMARGYGTYVRRATEKIRPDYLCFDLYPFFGELTDCSVAREFTMSENMSIVSANARLAGVSSVAYLQNVQFKGGIYANFHHLRWFASWAIAFGIREFANFISHDSVVDENDRRDIGLLDLQNNETKLGSDQRSVFGFLQRIQYELIPQSYSGIVAPFIGIKSGAIVEDLSSPDVLAGEYFPGTSNQAMVFFARRPVEGRVQTEVDFYAWYKMLEYLNVDTGQWELVAQSVNSIQIELAKFPGALYRLTR